MSVHAPIPATDTAEPRPVTRTMRALGMAPSDLDAISFEETRSGSRYCLESVDALLRTIAAAMREGVLPLAIRHPEAAKTFRVGYPTQRVDCLLRRLRAQGAITF